MKLRHIISVIVAFCIMAMANAQALTVDELARYLSVTAFSTTVKLPAESFTAEIWTIKDGEPDKLLIDGMAAWNKNPEKGITVMIGADNGKYRIVIAYGGGVTKSIVSGGPNFRSTMSEEFPKTIQEGDFPLMGEPKVGGSQNAREISAFQQGFLLRIIKNGQIRESQE